MVNFCHIHTLTRNESTNKAQFCLFLSLRESSLHHLCMLEQCDSIYGEIIGQDQWEHIHERGFTVIACTQSINTQTTNTKEWYSKLGTEYIMSWKHTVHKRKYRSVWNIQMSIQGRNQLISSAGQNDCYLLSRSVLNRFDQFLLIGPRAKRGPFM